MEANLANSDNDSWMSDYQEAILKVRKSTQLFLTLNCLDGTSSRFIGADIMILLFTSDYCTWCEVIKTMLDDECEDLGTEQQVYEVDVEKQYRIAEAYGILAVPTLVAGPVKISGVPTSSDLRSFLLQAVSRGLLRPGKKMVQSVLREVRQIRDADTKNKQIIRTLS